MNYQQSEQILALIHNTQSIIVNCHARPDVDSLSSAFSMCQVLKQMGKSVTIICPDDPLPEVDFLPCASELKKINYRDFDFSSYGLFIILDSASPEVVTGSKTIQLPLVSTVIIDHHKTNTGFGNYNLVDSHRSSTAELLYLLFSDWNIIIDKNLATTLLTGILGDTGAFEYHNTTPQTLRIAADLMADGADKDEILLRIFRTKNLELLKFWGEVLHKMEIDASGKFTWCAIPYEIYEKHKKPQMARESASSLFSRMLGGTEFGIVMVEEEPETLKVSLRSRGNYDVSPLAVALGGGGHRGAAGATLTGANYQTLVDSVLTTIRSLL